MPPFVDSFHMVIMTRVYSNHVSQALGQSCCFPRCIGRGAGWEGEAAGTRTSTYIGCWCHRWRLNPLATMLASWNISESVSQGCAVRAEVSLRLQKGFCLYPCGNTSCCPNAGDRILARKIAGAQYDSAVFLLWELSVYLSGHTSLHSSSSVCFW